MHPVVICSLLALTQPVLGWGDVGHRTVGYLAQHYFTSQASQWVNTLLSNENGWDISDAATWADVVKRKRPYSAGWHYIGKLVLKLLAEMELSSQILDAKDDPPQSCGVTFRRDCAGKGSCIVAAIINQVRTTSTVIAIPMNSLSLTSFLSCRHLLSSTQT
jgi:hypothetical protein